MDGSLNEGESGAGLILISPKGHRMYSALRFSFQASNNEAEYEALIARLKLAKEMRLESLEIYSNSQLIVCQVTNEYQARGEKMAAYLRSTHSKFDKFPENRIPKRML